MGNLTLVRMPLQLGPGQLSTCANPLAPKDQRVLWMHASFPYTYPSPAAEVALLRSADKSQRHWSPTTRDFKAIVDFEVDAHNKKLKGTASAVLLTNLQSFVAAFAPFDDGKVARVNIITHASSTILALSGTVDGTDGTTMLGLPANYDPNLEPEPARQHYLVNSRGIDAGAFFRQGLRHGWFNNPDEGRAYRDKIRKKLAPCAEFHIYACNTADGSGLNMELMKSMANTFNARVYGFTVPLYYHPRVVGNAITERRITGVGKDEADAIAHEQLGVIHNDERAAFVGVFSPTTPAP